MASAGGAAQSPERRPPWHAVVGEVDGERP